MAYVPKRHDAYTRDKKLHGFRGVVNGKLVTYAPYVISFVPNPNLASLAKLQVSAGGGYTYDNYKWRIVKLGRGTDGLMFVADELTVGETYTLSFKVQKVSGTLSKIGGHIAAYTQKRLTIDGVEKTGDNYYGGATVADDDKVHECVLTVIYNGAASDSSNYNLYIQINRNASEAITYDIWDIKVEQGDTATPWIPAEEDVGVI